MDAKWARKFPNDEAARLTAEAAQILWNDLGWRKELASQRRPTMLGHFGTEALMKAGWSYTDEVRLVDFFEIYRSAMIKVDAKLEECQSGRYTDGLYFYNLKEFEADFKELDKFIKDNF